MERIELLLSGFFNWVVLTSIMASVLVALIFVVRFVLKDSLKVKWRYIIWFVLFCRLVIPFAPESSFSLFNLFSFMNKQEIAAVVSDNTFAASNQAASANATSENSSQSNAVEPLQTTPDTSVEHLSHVEKASSFHSGLLLLWLFGVVAFALYLLLASLKLAKKTKCSDVTNERILKLFEQCSSEMRVKPHIPLMSSPTVEGPTLYGFIRPIILLPAQGLERFSTSELKYIFLHELVHYKRKDIFFNWFMTFLLIVHWFNPLLWFSYRKMREDQELSCDAAALSHIPPDEVKEYGYTIIKLLENYTQYSRTPAITNFSADKSQLKRRIKMITFFKKHSYKWSILGVAVLILLSGCALTNGKASDTTTTAKAPVESPKTDTNTTAQSATPDSNQNSQPEVSCNKLPVALEFSGKAYQLKAENSTTEPGMKLGYLKCVDGRFAVGDATDAYVVYSAGNPSTNSDIIVFGDNNLRALYTLGNKEQTAEKALKWDIVSRGYTFQGTVESTVTTSGKLAGISFKPEKYIVGNSPIDQSPIELNKSILLKLNQDPITEQQKKNLSNGQKVTVIVSQFAEGTGDPFWGTDVNSIYYEQNGVFYNVVSGDKLDVSP